MATNILNHKRIPEAVLPPLVVPTALAKSKPIKEPQNPEIGPIEGKSASLKNFVTEKFQKLPPVLETALQNNNTLRREFRNINQLAAPEPKRESAVPALPENHVSLNAVVSNSRPGQLPQVKKNREPAGQAGPVSTGGLAIQSEPLNLRESQAPLLEKQTVTLPITPKETVPNLKRQVVVLPPPETLKTTQPLERERQAPPPPETLRTIPPIQQEKRGPAQEITPREGVPNLSKQVTPVQPPETLKTIQPLPQKKQTPEPVIIPTETNQQAKGQEIHPPLIVRPNPPRPIIRAETPTPRLTPVQEKIRPLLAQESGRGNPKVEPAAARQAPSSTAGVNVARQVPLRITPTLDINASAQTTVSSETTKINVKPLVIPPSGQTTVSTQIRNSAQALNLLQQRVREGGIQSLVLQAHEAISHLQVHPSALTFTLREALGPHEPLHIRTLTNQASNPIPPLVRPSLTPRVTETVARIPQNNHNTHPARNPTPATGAIAPSNPNTGIVGLTAQETNNQVSNAVNAARQRQLATNLRSHLVPVQSVNLLDIIL